MQLKTKVDLNSFPSQSRRTRQQHQVSLCTAAKRSCLSGVSIVPRFSLYCTLRDTTHSWSWLLLTDVAVRIFCIVPRTSSCLPPGLNINAPFRHKLASGVWGVCTTKYCVYATRTVLQPNDSNRKTDGGTIKNY